MDTAAAQKIGRMREVAERKADKRVEKKRELARSAILTLAQLGYANTSLRDIATQSGVSVGVIHYYFEDKIDLISYCVEQYKAEFVARMRLIIDSSTSPDSMVEGFIDGLARTIEEDADAHRLWYDIRTQALFDESFRPTVNEIEGALIGIVRHLLDRLGATAIDPIDAYAALDGRFRYCLQHFVQQDANAVRDFRAALARLFLLLGLKD
ncbi:TetR family transcriptional regulator [Mesorhizobium sp. L-8-10]|uniref:TetR/AcrR family transcriptional regulator n=1 Tax=Mesorhizobium sp. L-8-10 TaxID=2744523 RepID=UPI001929647D|nr:TetR/AcrR family transcriptional regulator [Mesorhizobium sp. L-8-10]BCH35611.1 TetR family transcriptional regulator [Mesorhizobium sp. L-8-10]